MDSQEKKDLLQHFTDKSRELLIVGNRAELPKLFDEEGNTRDSWATPDSRHKLNFDQLRFLKAFEETGDLDQACAVCGKDLDWGKRFLKRHQEPTGYLWEKEKVKQLSQVATPDWTKAKAVQGVTGEWIPNKAQVECLKLVKDINFPRASANIQINNNLLTLPANMTPAEEQATRDFFDTLARESHV